MYVFVSFGSLHSRKPLGACIVEVEDAGYANEETKRLQLMPEECNGAYGYVLTEDGFKKQGMELNKFYGPDDMEKLGFEKASKTDGCANNQEN